MSYQLRPLPGTRSGLIGSKELSKTDPARSQLLLDFNNAVVSQLDFEELLKSIFEGVKRVFKQTIAATISIHDAETNQLRVHLLHSDDPDLFHKGMPIALEHTPSGTAFSSRQTVLIDRLLLEDFPSELIERALADGIRSGCSVPLISHNRVVGTLTVGAENEGAYDEADADLLAQVGLQLAMPIENALNFREAKRERDRNQLLLDVNNAVASTLDVGELLYAISERLQSVVPHDATGLAVWDEEINQLRMHSAVVRGGQAVPVAEGTPIPMEGTPSGLSFSTRQTVIRERPDFEEFYDPMFRQVIQLLGLVSGCSVPLILEDRVVGVISLSSRKEAAFTQQDLRFLEDIGGQLAIAVENARNFRRAQRERDRKQLLLDINNAVVTTLTLKDLLKTISDCLAKAFHHDAASISLYEEDIGQFRMHANELNYSSTLEGGVLFPMEGTPAGHVFKTRKTLRLTHVKPEDFPSPIIQLAIGDGLKSGCSIPLIVHDNFLGVLEVASRRENAFSEADAEALTQVAAQIAIAVQNSLNFERANRERERAQTLLEINNAITTNLDLHNLIHATAQSLRRYFKQDFAGLALYDEETTQLTVHSIDSSRPEEFLIEGAPFPMEGTLNGLAFTTRKPVVRNRIDPAESSWPLAKQFFDEHGMRSVCFVPMISGGEVLGVLSLGNKQEDAFSDGDVELLLHIAGQISIAVRNSLNFDRARKAKERAQILLEANNAIATSLDVSNLLLATARCLRRYFNHDVTGLALYDESRQALTVHSVDRHENNQFVSEGTALPVSGTPAAEVFNTGRPILEWRMDFEKYPDPQMRKAYDAGWRSGACVPLIVRDRVLGTLGLISFHENAFSNYDSDLFLSIAGQVALAVENTRQYRQIEALKNKLASEKLYLEEEIKTRYNFAEIIGQSDSLRDVLRQVETVAPTDSTVLLIGETGTGKELIARAIHNLSSRKERTLVKLNCAAIPTGLLESELFGHEKGAFTGAIAPRVGRFELAHKGTLLLDEIGEIPLELQPKLLRVLQEQEFERLGSSRTVKTDTRLIAATNCDLAQMVSEKKFRSDLYYRLNVFPVYIPPLRQRPGDIPLLVGYFAQKHAARMNKKIQSIPKQTMESLSNYHWPGNVRELENFIERSVILSQGSDLQSPLAELETQKTGGNGAADKVGRPKLTTMDEMERAYIEEVLSHVNGAIAGKGGAAEILGMPSSTLRSRMKKLGLK